MIIKKKEASHWKNIPETETNKHNGPTLGLFEDKRLQWSESTEAGGWYKSLEKGSGPASRASLVGPAIVWTLSSDFWKGIRGL